MIKVNYIIFSPYDDNTQFEDLPSTGCLETLKQNQQEIICDFCSQAFPTKLEIKIHFMSEHQILSEKVVNPRKKLCKPKQQFKNCEICKKKLKGSACLEMKQELHSCPKCQKEFKEKAKLKRHILNVHDKIFNGKDYKCADCSAVFTRRSDLKDHSFLHSSDVQTFICLICGQQFFSLAKLKFHNYTHNPQRVQCEICLKVFARQAAVRKHQIQSHTVRSLSVPSM